MKNIEIYVTRYCGYCVAVKRLLDGKGVAYEVIDVTGDASRRAWLQQVTGQRTVPQVFIDGQGYGGFTDLAALDAAGRLDTLLGLDSLPTPA